MVSGQERGDREHGTRVAKTGRNAPRLSILPGAAPYPRKREPTRAVRSTLSRRVRGVLSPSRERGGCGACALDWIPAYAGMTVMGAGAGAAP